MMCLSVTGFLVSKENFDDEMLGFFQLFLLNFYTKKRRPCFQEANFQKLRELIALCVAPGNLKFQIIHHRQSRSNLQPIKHQKPVITKPLSDNNHDSQEDFPSTFSS